MQIIGGMFGLVDVENVEGLRPSALFIKENSLLLVNARSAIKMVAHHISPPKVWMPSYLCDSLLKAVAGFDIQFYDVSDNFYNHNYAWIKDVQAGDLIVYIDYFGFPFKGLNLPEIKNKGAWLLEDASQALLSDHVGVYADFVVYSPRKFLGIPDGGVLVFNESNHLGEIRLDESPPAWWLGAYSAALLRRGFDCCGGDRKWFALFQEAEKSAPIGPYAMSDFSRKLLLYAFDYDEIRRKRTENYQALSKKLMQYAIFPELLSGIIPIGFPIRLENRDYVIRKLFKNDIYPPVHWDLETVVPSKFAESHKLSKQIMTLPCDQRYGLSDMDRMAEIVLQNV